MNRDEHDKFCEGLTALVFSDPDRGTVENMCHMFFMSCVQIMSHFLECDLAVNLPA